MRRDRDRAAGGRLGGWTAPAYPGNTLVLEHDGPIVAGTVVRVRMSGHAEWGEPTDQTTGPYSPSLFVQNPDIEPNCAPSYGSQLQMGINLDLGGSRTVTARLARRDGTGSVATRRLARGTYRVTVWAGDLRLGRPFRIQVR
jgi:hypothetical protein